MGQKTPTVALIPPYSPLLAYVPIHKNFTVDAADLDIFLIKCGIYLHQMDKIMGKLSA